MAFNFDVNFLNNTTRTMYLPAFRAQIFNDPVTFNRLHKKGRIKDMTGRGLEGSVGLIRHSSTGLTGGYAKMATQPSNPTVNYTLQPGKYYATVSIAKDEERMNTGNKEKLLGMLDTQMKMAYPTMRDEMITDLFGSSTTRGSLNTIVGLLAAIDTDNTYANINRATAANAGWKANRSDSAYTKAVLRDETEDNYMPNLMRTYYTNASNDYRPDLLVSDAATWNLYQDIMGDKLRFLDNKGDAGFDSVQFNGVEYVFDKYCNANHLYFLSTKTITFYVYPDANFSMTEAGWYIPDGQDVKTAHIIWMGQMLCNQPRNNAVLTSVGAS